MSIGDPRDTILHNDTIWKCSHCGQWIIGNVHNCPSNSAATNYTANPFHPQPDPKTLERIANALERIAAALEAQSQKAT